MGVIKKHPHAYEAYEGLVKIYQHQHAYDEITEILRYLVKHNPHNDSYLAQLGSQLLKAKRYADAVAAYQRSIAINPLVAVRFVNMGQAYLPGQWGTLQSSLKRTFSHALDLDPTNVRYLTKLVDLLVDEGESAKALAKLQAFLKIDPDSEEAQGRNLPARAGQNRVR